ncbi:hypothetical protein JCM19297_2382 [Nonlabens ulvanivorans]|nr:hypothetical protein JCM19297_2382 [Nonlabens ulvanivorans]
MSATNCGFFLGFEFIDINSNLILPFPYLRYSSPVDVVLVL